jgi:hypothetical protein
MYKNPVGQEFRECTHVRKLLSQRQPLDTHHKRSRLDFGAIELNRVLGMEPIVLMGDEWGYVMIINDSIDEIFEERIVNIFLLHQAHIISRNSSICLSKRHVRTDDH